MFAFIMLVILALLIIVSIISIYLYAEHKRWKDEYNGALQQAMTAHSAKLRELKEELSKEQFEKIQLRERVNKLELTISGYRSLITEAHDMLSQSMRKDYKSLTQDLRDMRIRMLIFAKNDDSLADVPVSEKRRKDFVHKLMLTYPGVSESSAQLAYMIAVNTPVPTICQILNITAKSVQMARFRLRKKLDLKEPDSLEDTLQALFDK